MTYHLIKDTNDYNNEYIYFGGIEEDDTYRGLRILTWEKVYSYYIGECNDNNISGYGIYRRKEYSTLAFYNDGYKVSGPVVQIFNNSILFCNIVNDNAEGKGFIVRPNRKISVVNLHQGHSLQSIDFDLVVDCDILPKIPSMIKFDSPYPFKALEYKAGFFDSTGKLSGNGYSIYKDGSEYIGHFNNGLTDGFGMYSEVKEKGKSFTFCNWENHHNAFPRAQVYNYGKETYCISGQKADGTIVCINYSRDGVLSVATYDKDYTLLSNVVVDVDFEKSEDLSSTNKIEEKSVPLKRKTSVSTPEENSVPIAKKSIEDPEEELKKLIGLKSVKDEIEKIKAYAIMNKHSLNLHMCFEGNPGTGKTIVARLIAGIFKKYNILPEDKLIETDRTGLVGKYIGHTGDKTHQLISKAMGGVLFIDEAYQVAQKNNERDFGDEAVGALLKEMEDNRGKFCVILAGYRNEMENLLETNPGFKSRVQFIIDFPDYSYEELIEIAKYTFDNSEDKYIVSDEVIELIAKIADSRKDQENFANAREVRNIIQEVILFQNLRAVNIEKNPKNHEILKIDVEAYMNKYKIDLKTKEKMVIKSGYEKIKTISESYNENNYTIDKSQIEESTVYLQMYDKDGTCKGEGTGFIIAPDGLCATCAHCVEGVDRLVGKTTIITRRGQRDINTYETDVIEFDHENDVAIFKLRIDDNLSMAYLPLSKEEAQDPSPLTDILMAGFPFGGNMLPYISFTEGKVQSVNPGPGGNKVVCVDLTGHSGNSGSAVLDEKTGRVLGVFSGAFIRNIQEINFYRPIEFVWNLIKKNK